MTQRVIIPRYIQVHTHGLMKGVDDRGKEMQVSAKRYAKNQKIMILAMIDLLRSSRTNSCPIFQERLRRILQNVVIKAVFVDSVLDNLFS